MREDWEELERRQGASLERPGKFVALGVLAMVVFLAWTQFSGRRDDAARSASEPAALEASMVPSPVIEPPEVIEAPAAHYQGPPPSRTGRESYVGVYECTIHGQRVVSDKPCGEDAQARTLVIDQPDPREAARQRQTTQSAGRSGSSYYTSPSAGSSTSRSGSTATASNEVACEAVDRAIDNLNARMRQRYGAAEGERLRAQWHALKQQRYDLKCGR
jgi:hypothetical protein